MPYIMRSFATDLHYGMLQSSFFCLFFAKRNGEMMKKERIMYDLLLLTSLWVLVLTVVPHHHHLDGLLCITTHNKTLATTTHAHAQGCDMKTGNHPQMIVENNTSRIKEEAARLPYLSFFLSFYFQLIPYTSVVTPDFPTIYHEVLHSVWIVKSLGLRAPPLSFT